MKKILKLAICAGISIPLFASAQVVVNGPVTTTNPADASSSTFHDLVIAMSASSNALYTPEGASLSITSPVYFNYMASGSGFSGTWSNAAGPVPSIKFVKMNNFGSFIFAANGTLDVGFIGEESAHNNTFGFVEGGNYTELNNWNAGGDKAPMSWQLTSATATSISFRQNNLTVGGPNGVGLQIDSDRFRIYGAEDSDGNLTGEFLFAIADRSGTKDGDYDDGFFYISGDITPVPEPSQIAALAMVGLGGLLYVRRRIRRNRK